MIGTYKRGLVIVCAAGALAACADQPRYAAESNSYPAAQQYAQYGVVDRIEVIGKNAGSNVAGTVIGGIVGGLIGHQIGSGRGQTAATIAGAAGGALAGNVIEGRRRRSDESFRVSVRLDNGSYQTVVQENIEDLRIGDRVRVQDGQIIRI